MDDEEEQHEQILFMHRDVKVYQIPPRIGTRSYRAEEWVPPHGKEIATCRMRIISKGMDGFVRLEDSNTGDLFAETPIKEPLERFVEPCLDSSRYFVMRVEDRETGGHAFLGAGFLERGAAFDFNVALQEHLKYVKRGGITKPGEESKIDWGPMKDLTLKEGETIKVSIGSLPPKGTAKAAGGSAAAPAAGFAGLAPPPPPAPTRRKAVTGGGGGDDDAGGGVDDDWADFGGFESAFDAAPPVGGKGASAPDLGFGSFGADFGGADASVGGEGGFGEPSDWASFGGEEEGAKKAS